MFWQIVLQNKDFIQVRIKDMYVAFNLVRGGTRNFPTGGLTLLTRGLKYGFQGNVNAKNLQQNSFTPSDGEASMFRQGSYSPL